MDEWARLFHGGTSSGMSYFFRVSTNNLRTLRFIPLASLATSARISGRSSLFEPRKQRS